MTRHLRTFLRAACLLGLLVPSCAPPLRPHSSKDSSGRFPALVRILEIEDRRGDPGLLAPESVSTDAGIRARAALAAGRIGGARAAALLVPMLDDPDVEVRLAAVFALGETDEPGAAAPLAGLLGPEPRSAGPDASSRDAALAALAAEAIGKLKADAGAPALVESLTCRCQPPIVERAALLAVWKVASRGAAASALARALSKDPALERRSGDLENEQFGEHAVEPGREFLVGRATSGAGYTLRAAAVYALMRLAESTTFAADRPHTPIVSPPEAMAIGEALETLLAHDDPQIRQDAARGLGLLKRKGSIPLLAARTADDPSWGCRVNALRALASFGSEAPVEPFARALQDRDPHVVFTAIEGLGRRGFDPTGASLGLVRPFLTAPLARARALAAATTLQTVGGTGLDAVRRLEIDPEWTVRAAVAEAYADLATPPIPEGADSAAARDSAAHSGVAARLAAREGLGRLLRAESDPRAVAAILGSALRVDPPAADPRSWLSSYDPIVRATALDGIGKDLARLRAPAPSSPATDPAAGAGAHPAAAAPDTGPRALEAIIALRDGFRRGASDPLNDARLTALDAVAPFLPGKGSFDPAGERPQGLARIPTLPAETAAAVSPPLPAGSASAAGGTTAGTRAAAGSRPSLARLVSTDPVLAGALELHIEALRDPDRLVRKRAAEHLREKAGLDAEGSVGEESSIWSRADLERALVRGAAGSARNPRARIRLADGEIIVALAPRDAPLTVENFIRLARSRSFDGHTWHRVVPNFVVQDGCPRGDGSGGPGYAIRCEINPRRYGRGAVGMALSGKDTGGSQFFITHAPQPHLDGGYTVFGEVVSGWKLLDRIRQGDPILSVAIEEPGAGK